MFSKMMYLYRITVDKSVSFLPRAEINFNMQFHIYYTPYKDHPRPLPVNFFAYQKGNDFLLENKGRFDVYIYKYMKYVR